MWENCDKTKNRRLVKLSLESRMLLVALPCCIFVPLFILFFVSTLRASAVDLVSKGRGWVILFFLRGRFCLEERLGGKLCCK